MDRQVWWWFRLCLLTVLFHSIESRHFLQSIDNQNESKDQNQTSTNTSKHFFQSHSIFSTTLASTTTTIRSNSTLQSFITKPNSYLYDPSGDDEVLLDRLKRESPPFVCKGRKTFFCRLCMKCSRPLSSRWLFSRSTELSNISYMYFRSGYGSCVWRRNSMGSD